MRIQEGSLEAAPISEKVKQALLEADNLLRLTTFVRQIIAESAKQAMSAGMLKVPESLESLYEIADRPETLDKMSLPILTSRAWDLGVIDEETKDHVFAFFNWDSSPHPTKQTPLNYQDYTRLNYAKDYIASCCKTIREQQDKFCAQEPMLEMFWKYAKLANGDSEKYQQLIAPMMPSIRAWQAEKELQAQPAGAFPGLSPGDGVRVRVRR